MPSSCAHRTRMPASAPSTSAAASSAPGVPRGADRTRLRREGLKPLPNTPNPRDVPLTNRNGRPVLEPPDYPLAVDKVRHAGEGVR